MYTGKFLDNPTLSAWLLSLAVLFFYFCNTLTWWLYGLKQWIISIEVPKKLSGEADTTTCVTKKCYRILKWSGIVVNLGVSVAVAFYRYKLIMQLAHKEPKKKAYSVIDFRLVMTSIGLAIVSGMFLADALRRLRISF